MIALMPIGVVLYLPSHVRVRRRLYRLCGRGWLAALVLAVTR